MGHDHDAKSGVRSEQELRQCSVLRQWSGALNPDQGSDNLHRLDMELEDLQARWKEIQQIKV